jgi:hypothetical protein
MAAAAYMTKHENWTKLSEEETTLTDKTRVKMVGGGEGEGGERHHIRYRETDGALNVSRQRPLVLLVKDLWAGDKVETWRQRDVLLFWVRGTGTKLITDWIMALIFGEFGTISEF